MEIVRDGSEGGAAVLRARGMRGNNDFINLKGIGVLPVGDDLDPDVPDQLVCATTYVLAPGARHVEVYWSIYNAGTARVIGPLGMLNDTGGETEQWANGRGFERAGIEALSALTEPAPINYVVYESPPAGYGVIPRFDTPTPGSAFLIAGVSIVLFGADNLLDNVIGKPQHKDQLMGILFSESTTLGVRFHYTQRRILERSSAEIESPWGRMKVKKVLRPDGSFQLLPEFEECRRIAKEKGIPLRDIYGWVAGQGRSA